MVDPEVCGCRGGFLCGMELAAVARGGEESLISVALSLHSSISAYSKLEERECRPVLLSELRFRVSGCRVCGWSPSSKDCSALSK
jgi:hypothetical protein